MENPIFYAINYNDPDNNDTYIRIVKGPYTHYTSTKKPYQSVVGIGCVNITQRYFLKQAKNPRKITDALGDFIIFDNMTYKPLPVLLANLNYSEELINEISTVVTSASQDKNIKVNNPFVDGGNTYGIVNF